MKVYSLDEARDFFLRNSSESVVCVKTREEKECKCYPEAQEFFSNTNAKTEIVMPLTPVGIKLKELEERIEELETTEAKLLKESMDRTFDKNAGANADDLPEMEGSGVEKEPSRGLAEVPMPDAKRKDINIEDAIRKMEGEPTKTIELTEDEIKTLRDLLVNYRIDLFVDSKTKDCLVNTNNLLNKLNGK